MNETGMKGSLSRALHRLQTTFAGFTAGQKTVAVIGTAALLLGGFLVFRWAAAPTYTPLFSNLAASDASAIVEELNATGVPYEIGGGGNTILVPSDKVYATRIALSGEGLPGESDNGGYHLLDNQSISTSQFQEQTSFKRAMEGELTNTIEAIDGVDAAVVHLAMPPKEVFSDEQDPTTASVLVQTRAGATLAPDQVQAVVNLVSASVDGLDPEKVTVADSTGKLLSAPGGTGAGAAQSQNQQVTDFELQKTAQVQVMLDRIFGVGNATVQTTAQLSFDKTVTDSVRYFDKAGTPLSESASSEELTGAAATNQTNGLVGTDGNTEPTTGTDAGAGSTYTKRDSTQDNALDTVREHREAAPGGVESLHVGIVIDPRALKGADLNVVQTNIASALGLDRGRGDTIDVSSLPFDRTAETAAAAELAAQQEAEKKAATMAMARNGGLVLLLVIMVLVAWLQARRRAKARAQATTYVVEQLRQDAATRKPAAELEGSQSPAVLALEAAEADESTRLREEISALVERQPEDVAALLRGWLVEAP